MHLVLELLVHIGHAYFPDKPVAGMNFDSATQTIGEWKIKQGGFANIP